MVSGRIIVLSFWTMMLLIPAAALLAGIAYFAYWSVPRLPIMYEGDPLFAFDPKIGYVARPNSSTRWATSGASPIEYHVYTDGRGARVAAPTQAKPAAADIVFIGDSFTWGHGVEYDDTFAAKTFSSLGGRGVNLALASYGTTHSLLTLRRHRDLAPRLIVYPINYDHLWRNVSACARSFYPFCLDFAHVAQDWQGRRYIAGPWSDGVRRLLLHLQWEREGLDPLTWLRHGLDVTVARFSFQMADLIASDTALQGAALEYLIEEMAATTREMNARLLLVFIPDQSMAGVPEGLAPTAARLALPFLDLTPRFAEMEPTARQELYIGGDGHPSVAGHVLIGREITAFARGR